MKFLRYSDWGYGAWAVPVLQKFEGMRVVVDDDTKQTFDLELMGQDVDACISAVELREENTHGRD